MRYGVPMWFWILPAALAAETLTPTRLQEPITVDGVLESAWDPVPWVENFTTFRPSTGDPDPSARAKVAITDTALVVAFEVKSIPGTPLVQPLVPRDDTLFHDWVGVTVDTFGDAQRAAVFRSTPSGVQADGMFVEGDHIWMHSLSWDAVFESAGVSNEAGYTVEMAIPFRSLRYRAESPQEWGILLTHFTPSPWVVNAWPPLSRETAGLLQQAARLGPVEPPPPKMHVEVQPTLVGALGLAEGSENSIDPGLSGRVGLTSAITVDFAVNPDFSQIEADAEKVEANVKYPLFYKEKRPFFLEGADLYDSQIPVSYSRSVADPLFGYKLTGRSGGWAYGGLGALDEAPTASTIFLDYATGEARPGWDEDTVAGRQSLVHMGRVRREMDRGRSVGILVSDKELLGGADPLGNRVGAIDGALQVGEQVRIYALGLYSQTDLPGGDELAGPAWSLLVDRSGHTVNLSLEQYGVSEEFRAENGFLKDVGRMGANAEVDLHLTDVGPARYLGPGLRASAQTDMAGAPVSIDVGPKVEGMVGDWSYTRMGAVYERERYLGQDFDFWRFRGFASVDPTPHSDVNFGWRIGPKPHYDAVDEDDLYLGFSWRGEVGLEQQLLGSWLLDYRVIGERFGRTWDAEPVYSTLLHRFQTSYFLSRELGMRWISDYNQYEKDLESSLLFSYRLNHGTAVYLGGAVAHDLDGSDPPEGSLFAKLSWLYRP
jgi:hypothetical protein